MSQLKAILIDRLTDQGMDPTMIPGFIRSLSNTLHVDPYMTLQQVKKRLKYMGWDDVDLDYFTYQLAVECLDSYGLTKLEYKPVQWFNNIFLKHQSI